MKSKARKPGSLSFCFRSLIRSVGHEGLSEEDSDEESFEGTQVSALELSVRAKKIR